MLLQYSGAVPQHCLNTKHTFLLLSPLHFQEQNSVEINTPFTTLCLIFLYHRLMREVTGNKTLKILKAILKSLINNTVLSLFKCLAKRC